MVLGEARRRKRLTQQVLENCGFCVYCGGLTTADTVDHLPPRSVFDLRRRPRGLEFPACATCNSGGRTDELVAAMLSRIYPDADTAEKAAETKRLITSVSKWRPGLLEEMQPSLRQMRVAHEQSARLPPNGGVLNCQGPLLNRSINRFGAKLGFALHFEIAGKAIPPAGAVCVWWLTNFSAVTDELPQNLIDMLGPPQTLRQGAWSVSDQFSYASRATPNGAMSAHFATFRRSFAVCAFAAEEADRVRPPDGVSHVEFFQPGWLQGRAASE